MEVYKILNKLGYLKRPISMERVEVVGLWKIFIIVSLFTVVVFFFVNFIFLYTAGSY